MDDFTRPVLDTHPADRFTSLKTTYAVYFSICLMLFVEIVMLVYGFIWRNPEVRCDLFYLLVYADVSLWVINFIIRLYIKQQHKHLLIGRNFFEFDKECNRFIELPFYILCAGLGVLVVILCLYAEYDVPHEFYCDTSRLYSPVLVVIIAITIQNVLVVPLFLIYIKKINRFNVHHVSLVHENESPSMPSTLQGILTSADTGYRERCEVIDNMLEKQADLIRYYKEANEVLNKKILQLTAQGHNVVDS